MTKKKDEHARMKAIAKDLEGVWKVEEINGQRHPGGGQEHFLLPCCSQSEKKTIAMLEGPDGPVEDTKGFLENDGKDTQEVEIAVPGIKIATDGTLYWKFGDQGWIGAENRLALKKMKTQKLNGKLKPK